MNILGTPCTLYFVPSCSNCFWKWGIQIAKKSLQLYFSNSLLTRLSTYWVQKKSFCLNFSWVWFVVHVPCTFNFLCEFFYVYLNNRYNSGNLMFLLCFSISNNGKYRAIQNKILYKPKIKWSQIKSDLNPECQTHHWKDETLTSFLSRSNLMNLFKKHP